MAYSAPLCRVLVCAAALLACSPADAATGRRTTSALSGGAPPSGARTVPTFTDSFTFDGQRYPYRMVGTNPRTSSATTRVPTEIVPLRFVFADGKVFDGTPRVDDVLASPIFTPAGFDSGTTQFADAFRRAEFWSSVSANGGGYHVLLKPTVLPTVTVEVPAGRGSTGVANGVPYGLVDGHWAYANVAEGLIHRLHIDPTTLAILYSDAVYYSPGGDTEHCCTVGMHGSTGDWGYQGPSNANGRPDINTFIITGWEHAEHFGDGGLAQPGTNGGTEVLSHEVAEWLDDPFPLNHAPAWSSPIAPWYGCNSWLEAGDPLVSAERYVGGYNLQDEAFLSWFAHDVPSQGIGGRYTLVDTFTPPSTLC